MGAGVPTCFIGRANPSAVAKAMADKPDEPSGNRGSSGTTRPTLYRTKTPACFVNCFSMLPHTSSHSWKIDGSAMA